MRTYIGFGRRHCQRPHRQNARCEFVDEAAIFTGSAAARQSPGAVQRLAAMRFWRSLRRTAATFLRRSLHNRVGDAAMRGNASVS